MSGSYAHPATVPFASTKSRLPRAWSGGSANDRAPRYVEFCVFCTSIAYSATVCAAPLRNPFGMLRTNPWFPPMLWAAFTSDRYQFVANRPWNVLFTYMSTADDTDDESGSNAHP